MISITALTEFYNSTIKPNPLLTAGIAMWATTVIGFAFRTLPAKFYFWLRSRLLVTMRINDSTMENCRKMYQLLSFLSNHQVKAFSKNYTLVSSWENSIEHTKLVPGYGTHLFLVGWRLYWVTTVRTDLTIYDRAVTETEIATLGLWSNKAIESLFKKACPSVMNPDRIFSVYTPMQAHWNRMAGVYKRPIESIAMRAGLREEVLGAVSSWLENEEWYRRTGNNYKKTFLFYGPPGTGKTSLTKAIASCFSLPVYWLDPTAVRLEYLSNIIAGIPKGSILLLEDIDGFAKNRGDRVVTQNGTKEEDIDEETTPLPLTTFLNLLDGIVPLDGIITVMTTNCLDDLDPALIRDCRVDHLLEVGELETADIVNWFRYVYQDYWDQQKEEWLKTGWFVKIPGCKLGSITDTFKENGNAVWDSLVTQYGVDGGIPIRPPKTQFPIFYKTIEENPLV